MVTNTADVEKLVYGGEGLARQDGQVVLIPFVLPGEKVSITTSRVKTGLLRGSLVELVEASPERIAPRCEYFADCGGCHLQHAGYAFQLEQKSAILRETLRRIGGISYEADIPILSAEPWFYRNRVQLHFEDRKCGFHRAGSHDIRPIEHCEIAAPVLVDAIRTLQTAAKRPEWPRFLRSLEIFTNGSQIQLNVLDSNRPVAVRFFEWMKTLLPAMADGTIEYQAAGHTFRIGRGSFFQTNRFLIDALVNEVVASARGDQAIDLYAGVGLFSLPLARRFRLVDAVERGGSAFRDLEWNAIQGGSTNITPRRASAEEFLRGLDGAPEWIVADPPRAGLGPDATAELLRLKPARLTIVSCDPTTLARDLRKLTTGGFQIARLTLVDLFPQTYHFETVAHLEPG
ncbi:MAG TPA: class I SAM-dependent RNA methyltransferase [Bryobacteraceae bacterium]